MTHDLGERLQALAPPIDLPVDLIDGVRRRARRRLTAMGSGAVAGVAAVVVAVLLIVHVVIGPAGPSGEELRALVAAGSAKPVIYTGPGSESVKNTTLWLIGDYYSAPERFVIVSYRQNGHPCMGSIDWRTSLKVPRGPVYGFEGGCSLGTLIDSTGDYGPLGPPNMTGDNAYLFGTVPADVRVVRADVNSGPRLTQRFVATIGTPTTTKERFFVFVAPGGTDRGIDVDLTYFDINGDNVGSHHVHQGKINGDNNSGCPSPQPGSACAEVSATPPS